MIERETSAQDPKWEWQPEAAHLFATLCEAEYDEEPTLEVWPAWQSLDAEAASDRSTEAEYTIYSDEDCHVVAFRGTDMSGLADWRTNLDKDRKPVGGGGIHEGFHRTTGEIASAIFDVVADGRAVYLTGHSKGGAHATDLAYRAIYEYEMPIAGIMTFGSPRVVDEEIAGDLMRRLGHRWWRVVHNCDIVTRLPFSALYRWRGGYKHVGQEAVINADGSMGFGYGRWKRFKERVKGRFEALQGGEPTVDEVPDIEHDERNRLKRAGFRRLSQVAGATLIEVAQVVGMATGERVMAWAAMRLGGVSPSGIKDAVFDGTTDHAIGEYRKKLTWLAGGKVAMPRLSW